MTEIMRQPAYIVALTSSMFGYGVMTLIMSATPLAMLACGFHFDDSATVIQGHVVGMFLPSFFTGHLIARFGVERIIATGLLLLALAGVAALVAGAAAARELRRAGIRPLVYEKSRGPGGRGARRREGKLQFDHGAQFFTVRDSRFAEAVERALAEGAAAARLHLLDQLMLKYGSSLDDVLAHRESLVQEREELRSVEERVEEVASLGVPTVELGHHTVGGVVNGLPVVLLLPREAPALEGRLHHRLLHVVGQPVEAVRRAGTGDPLMRALMVVVLDPVVESPASVRI